MRVPLLQRNMKVLRLAAQIASAAIVLGADSYLFAQGGIAPATSTTITSESASIGALAISRNAIGPSPASTAQPLPRVFAPTLPRVSYAKYPWKTDIVTTVFWVGEPASAGNPMPNFNSSWVANWQGCYGGFDDPTRRVQGEYRPVAFVPKLNPFYIALPYNDCVDSSTTKKDASKIIPWFKQAFKKKGDSVCHNRWVAIRHGDRMCYAQWCDCGPFVTDDAAYVFGDARPANPHNGHVGLDVSPAVRDYLNFTTGGDGGKCDWRFVELSEIPDGPWKWYGSNNPFPKQAEQNKDLVASRLEELRRQRDEWFKKNGSDLQKR